VSEETPEEALKGRAVTAVTTGAYLAETLARNTHSDAESRARASEARTHELVARLDADRATAIAQLAVVHHDEWWSTAEPADVSAVRQTAEAWRQYDPAAEAAARVIDERLREGGAGDWLDRQAELHRATAEEEAAHADENQAAGVLAGAATDAEVDVALVELEQVATAHDDALERQHEAAANVPAWDSLERRGELDQRLAAAGVPEDARTAAAIADVGRATPPAAAAQKPARGKTAAARSRGVTRTADRGIQR
jgi:hypothetical protein